MMRLKSLPILAGAASALVLAFAGTPAQADTFTFTSCELTGGCGTATDFGTVTLTQNGVNVDFKVVLTGTLPGAGNNFVETGAGAKSLFLFNDTVSGSAVTNATATLNGAVVSTPAVSGLTNQSPIHADGTGDFTAQVFCTTLSDCNGNSGANINDLEFTVTNATLAQLETANTSGNIFVADILCGQTGCPAGGPTGLVNVTPAPVLGPGLLTLLAVGGLLFGGRMWGRGRKRPALPLAAA